MHWNFQAYNLWVFDARAKAIRTKFYKNSDIPCFRADWDVLGNIVNSALLLKYPTFEYVFFTF